MKLQPISNLVTFLTFPCAFIDLNPMRRMSHTQCHLPHKILPLNPALPALAHLPSALLCYNRWMLYNNNKRQMLTYACALDSIDAWRGLRVWRSVHWLFPKWGENMKKVQFREACLPQMVSLPHSIQKRICL